MSKNLFLLMQQQQIAEAFPTKKQVQSNAQQFANDLIESGEQDKLEMFAQAVRINEALSIVTDTLKKSLPAEKQTAYGIEIVPVNGRTMIQYSEDPIWQKLNNDLKAREELLKLALKQDVIDAYGNDVPKVSVKYASDSLTVKY
jgi:hypothetical protein